MLVDSHCHLDFTDFAEDFPGVLSRAKAAGVETMLSIATRLKDVPNILSLARQHPQIYATAGVHPHNVAEAPLVSTAELIRLASQDKIVGFGETGLDYYYEHSDRKAQQQSLQAHIAAAQETGLPIIIHTRDAEEDTRALLVSAWRDKPFPGLIHCFTASKAFADAMLEIGFYISISGIVTFKNATALQDVVRTLPLDRLLVETDAPYLAPMPHRGKRNEPAFVQHTAAYIAGLRGIDPQTLAQATTENFYRLFSNVSRNGP